MVSAHTTCSMFSHAIGIVFCISANHLRHCGVTSCWPTLSTVPLTHFHSCTEKVLEGGWPSNIFVTLQLAKVPELWKIYHLTSFTRSTMFWILCSSSTRRGWGSIRISKSKNLWWVCGRSRPQLKEFSFVLFWVFFSPVILWYKRDKLSWTQIPCIIFADAVHSHNVHSESKLFLGSLLISWSLIYLCRQMGSSVSHCLQAPEWVICAIYSVLLVVTYLFRVIAKLNFKISETVCIYAAVV